MSVLFRLLGSRLTLTALGFAGGMLAVVWSEGVDTFCRSAGYILLVQ